MTDEPQLYGQLTQRLAQWQRRRLLAESLVWLPRGLLAGLVAAAAVAALARFRPVLHNREVALLALAMALLGLAISLLALIARRPTIREQAIYYDKLFNLRERVSTAVEIESGRLSPVRSLGERQLADAALVSSKVEARSGLPFQPRWLDLILVIVAMGLLSLAAVLPNQQESILDEQQAVAQAISDEVANLQAIERRVLEEPELDAASREALLDPIRGALDELTTARLSREEAVAVLSEAEAELRELSERGDTEAKDQALLSASQSLSEEPVSAALGEAMARSDMTQASAAASQLAQDLAQLSAEAAERLAASLAESAALLAEIDTEMAAELSEVSQALQAGEIGQARQALDEAAATMQQRALDQALADQAQAAAAELQSSRAQVAAAGSEAEGSALNGNGQSGQAGAGQGQAGQDSDATTGVGPGTDSESSEGQGAGGPGPGGGHAETVYVPDYVDLANENGVEIQLPSECLANPENCGALLSESSTEFSVEKSLVSYEHVFGDYRDAAFEALEGDYVPLGMKKVVRDYFSSLEP